MKKLQQNVGVKKVMDLWILDYLHIYGFNSQKYGKENSCKKPNKDLDYRIFMPDYLRIKKNIFFSNRNWL